MCRSAWISWLRIMRGIGEVLSEPFDLPPIPAVLVNPGVALVTREVFGKFKGAHAGPSLADVPTKISALIELLRQQDNDLTVAATACAPVVGEVLATLRSAPGSALARMSGSGATCFALFWLPRRGGCGGALSQKRTRDLVGPGNNDWSGRVELTNSPFGRNGWQSASFPIVTGGMRGAQ